MTSSTTHPAFPTAPKRNPIASQSQNQGKPASLTVLSHLHASSHSSHSSKSIAEQHATQIQHKHLLLRPSSPDPNSGDARSTRRKRRLAATAKQRRKRRPKPLSAREKRLLGVYDLELRPAAGEIAGGSSRRRTKAEWDVWLGLYGLWVGYVWEVFGMEAGMSLNANAKLSPAFVGPKITSLDLHGGLVRIVKAQCASLVGICGVCVRETKFSVVLVDWHCAVRRIGKKGVVLALEVPLPARVGEESASEEGVGRADSVQLVRSLDIKAFVQGDGAEKIVFELSGKAIACRPVDRATKKFKGRKYDGF